MRKNLALIVAVGFLMSIGLVGLARSAEKKGPKVPYPEGYRKWTHVKSMIIQKGHPLYASFGGLHHIYANRGALRAMRQGERYPDGSVLVFGLLEARREEHAIVEGPRKIVWVMHKDKAKFKKTGGWGFEGFKGDSIRRAVADPKIACFECHKSKKRRDYVFSRFRK